MTAWLVLPAWMIFLIMGILSITPTKQEFYKSYILCLSLFCQNKFKIAFFYLLAAFHFLQSYCLDEEWKRKVGFFEKQAIFDTFSLVFLPSELWPKEPEFGARAKLGFSKRGNLRLRLSRICGILRKSALLGPRYSWATGIEVDLSMTRNMQEVATASPIPMDSIGRFPVEYLQPSTLVLRWLS